MDLTFFEGSAALVSAIIVFFGSVWLILTLLMGARLAYYVTASVSLGFILIMCVVWAINPLGPVGEMPEWRPVSLADEPGQLSGVPQASSYPEAPWRPVDEENDTETTQAGELQNEATNELEKALDDGKTEAFESAADATAVEEQTRLLESDGTLYGGVTLEAIEGQEGGPVYVVMSYDPGNPLGIARMAAVGTLALLVLHLVGLSRAERRAKEELQTT